MFWIFRVGSYSALRPLPKEEALDVLQAAVRDCSLTECVVDKALAVGAMLCVLVPVALLFIIDAILISDVPILSQVAVLVVGILIWVVWLSQRYRRCIKHEIDRLLKERG